MTSLSLKNISKRYQTGEKLALKNVSLSVSEGEFFCIVGPSGCGKSTLLKLISGIETPTSGTIEKPEKISMVFQSGALLPWLNVEQNTSFPLRMSGGKSDEIEKSTSRYIGMVGLNDYISKYPRELSGGQRQRVGIARALCTEPQMLLLDEPFSALDLLTTEELHADLLKIWQETKKTIVMVSHALDEALYLADRIAVMKDGELKQVLEVNFNRPRDINNPLFRERLHFIEKILGKD